MESRDVYLMLHFLLDVLTVLHNVSQCFQGQTTTVCDIMFEITTAIQHLEKLKHSDGFNLRDGLSKQPDDLKGNDTAFTSARPKLITVLVNSLQKRYFENDEIIGACSVLNLTHLPVTKQDAEGYGDDSIQILIDYFRDALVVAGVDVASCELEWTKLKNHLFTRFEDPHCISWEDVNTKLRTECPNILDLVDLLLTIPASSSDAERGFNRVKYTKNDFRCVLCDSSLSDQLTIMLESKNIQEFDPLPAIELWNLSPRRFRETVKSTVPIVEEVEQNEPEPVHELVLVNNNNMIVGTEEDMYVSDDDYKDEDDSDMIELKASYADRIALAQKVYENFCNLYPDI